MSTLLLNTIRNTFCIVQSRPDYVTPYIIKKKDRNTNETKSFTVL